MKHRRLITIIICAILAFLMIAGLLAPAIGQISANASNLEDQLTKLQKDAAELKARQDEVRAQINELTGQIMEYTRRKQLLDIQIELTQQEIDIVETQIEVISVEIENKQAEYDAVLLEEEEQVRLFKDHVRAMEEYGTISYFAILFEARSFSDLLGRIDFIREIMHYDEGAVDRLHSARERTAEAKIDLEEIEVESQKYKVLQIQKEEELSQQYEEMGKLLLELESDREAYEIVMAEIEAEKEQLDNQTADLVKKIAEEAERERKAREAALKAQQPPPPKSRSSEIDSIKSTGTYLWPSDSTRITDYYGMRDVNPASGKKNTPHNGLDIGANAGTNIYAADSGEVISAFYNGGYGNYILVAHGNGRMTAYAHLSKILVKVGQKVDQGDVIGYCGSTGNSTGPHLHFEVYENSVRVDPLNYF